MPKERLKAYLPRPEELHKNRLIRPFAPLLTDARLWQFNRNSLARAIYIGVFAAFLPLPLQMLIALVLALIVRANVPMSLMLTWITNPLTTLPVYWAAYWVGAQILGKPALSLSAIGKLLGQIADWLLQSGANPFGQTDSIFSMKVFALGLLISAILSALILRLIFGWAWRWRIVSDWRKRAGYQKGLFQANKRMKHK